MFNFSDLSKIFQVLDEGNLSFDSLSGNAQFVAPHYLLLPVYCGEIEESLMLSISLENRAFTFYPVPDALQENGEDKMWKTPLLILNAENLKYAQFIAERISLIYQIVNCCSEKLPSIHEQPTISLEGDFVKIVSPEKYFMKVDIRNLSFMAWDKNQKLILDDELDFNPISYNRMAKEAQQ